MLVLVLGVMARAAQGQATTLLEPVYCSRAAAHGRGVEEAFSQLLLLINQIQNQQNQLKQEVNLTKLLFIIHSPRRGVGGVPVSSFCKVGIISSWKTLLVLRIATLVERELVLRPIPGAPDFLQKQGIEI